MSFTQKIYYNNKPMILGIAGDNKLTALGYPVLQGASGGNFKQALAMLERDENKGVIVVDSSREQLEKELLWAFYPIHSGGGVVRNEAGDVLMIFRRGKWDLPKGKQDEGEDIATCALREVCEETGLKNIRIEHKICNSLHIYSMNNQMVLKYTAWYLMSGSSADKLQPQQEENIEQATWVAPAQIEALLQNSFDTVRDVLREEGIL
jgi:8-oxo-dGTP pyrophosphatase MutT (NUDIX family)